MRGAESVRILADDLTGALDSAAAFASPDQPFPVVWDAGALPESSAAVDLATREGGEAAAITRHEGCAVWLSDARLPFKKVDSLLRGHPAGEIAACIRGGGYQRVVIAPAFPHQGRATRDARQWAGDPPRPVGPDLIAELAARGVQAGSSADPGWAGPVTVFDAQSDADLDRVVGTGLRGGGRTLWVGAGGLAAALARRLAPECGTALPAASLHGPLLGLVGTDHPVTLAQLADLSDAEPGAALVIGAGHRAASVQQRLQHRGMAFVRVDAPADRAEAARRIAASFADLLTALRPPGCLVVTGGETLHAVATALGAQALDLLGAIEPGLPVSRFSGGRYDGTPVISKSGGFGGVDLFRRLVDSIQIDVARI